jgi:hypothetical protein
MRGASGAGPERVGTNRNPQFGDRRLFLNGEPPVNCCGIPRRRWAKTNTVHLNGFRTQAGNSSSLAPLGERGDRKAEGAPRSAGGGGEGVVLGTV